MRRLFHWIVCCGLLTSVFAEADEDWLKRRRRELLDEGKSLPEVRRILEEEKAERAKSPPAVESPSDKPSAPPEALPKPSGPAPTTTEEPSDQEQAGTSENDELEKIESIWKAKLEGAGLKGSELEKALNAEMAIQKKIVNLPERDKARESDSLHMDQATKILKASSIFKEYPPSYIDILTRDWMGWLQIPSSKQKTYLEDSCKKIEGKEVQKRKAKSLQAMNSTKLELKKYWTDKAYKQMPKAVEYFSTAWESLINTPSKDYEKARGDEKEKLKRNGFDPESIKIFFQGLDPLFEEAK